MASSFAFTNTTPMEVAVDPIDLQPTSLYATIESSKGEVILDNKTAPMDQTELLTYGYKKLKSSTSKKGKFTPAVSSKLTDQLAYPCQQDDGVQYEVRLDEVLRTTGLTTNPVDEQIVAYLIVRHPVSPNIKPTHIGQIIERLVGAARREDGTWRFDDLMRGGKAPTQD